MEPTNVHTTQPAAVTRIRHCDRCGTHLRGVDRLYGRCACCRVGADGLVPCPDCHGSGTINYLWYGERVTAAGGGNPLDARFVCPLCGNVATPRQFKATGVQSERAFQNCIGRFIGAKGNLSSPRPVPQPCDWAAYGLFGTLGKGTQVELEDGSTCWVFDLAEQEGGAA